MAPAHGHGWSSADGCIDDFESFFSCLSRGSIINAHQGKFTHFKVRFGLRGGIVRLPRPFESLPMPLTGHFKMTQRLMQCSQARDQDHLIRRRRGNKQIM
jgi:hypothetical protein